MADNALRRALTIHTDDFMRGQGYRVLRFWNNEVLGNMDSGWQVIVAEINSPASCDVTPQANLPPQGGKWHTERPEEQ